MNKWSVPPVEYQTIEWSGSIDLFIEYLKILQEAVEKLKGEEENAVSSDQGLS